MAVDAAVYRVAQAAGQGLEPVGQTIAAAGQIIELLIQGGGAAAKAQQLGKAQGIGGGDDQGHGQSHRVAQKGGGDPDHGNGAEDKGDSKKKASHTVLLTSLWVDWLPVASATRASSRPSMGSWRASSSASNSSCSSRRNWLSHPCGASQSSTV